ncbi:hypothetical protein FA13DRAFT_1080210 [Coprinellus micaceus]|uniref:RING-type domain-containing protein n=1 Tax=Coprinellus micaceus TaxID=71717 RepID=A0A4Y7TS11_COPMI|nr:hypothetical protein FA13DRAFT_1080210 [Coprinellus micaceus]
MMNCEHSFCRDCMTGHVRSQLEENLYPIICPVCFPDPERTTRGFVDDFVLEELDLTQKEADKFQDLQLATVIVKIDCPGCKQVLMVAREDYLNEPFITCNLPGCSSRFCRACLVVMEGQSDEHTCKVDEELDALMKANGWRYCPGCRTPILKESGCNHMTCKTPGCSTHFCYVCGDSIWDATSLESLHTLLPAHYRNCNQFDPDRPVAPRGARGARRRRGECAIQ